MTTVIKLTAAQRAVAIAIENLRNEILAHTGRASGIDEIVVSADVGMCLGFAPGEHGEMNGVKVRSSAKPPEKRCCVCSRHHARMSFVEYGTGWLCAECERLSRPGP